MAQQLQDGCGACFQASQGSLEVPEDGHNVPWFVVSVCMLHNICKAKGELRPKPTPQPIEAEWSLAPTGAVPANSQTEAIHLVLCV